MNLHPSDGAWLNEPAIHDETEDEVRITTEPHSDLWQRTYYGFRNDNAPMLLWESAENLTFTVRVRFSYAGRFDQCGIVVYQNTENWCKASIEYDTVGPSRLGGVVTNAGHSDWATTDVEVPPGLWYRLSRRGPDFLIETAALDSPEAFTQMRIFHLASLGETSTEMGRADPPLPPTTPIRFGLYACSPLDSSFEARFDSLATEPCRWQAHA